VGSKPMMVQQNVSYIYIKQVERRARKMGTSSEGWWRLYVAGEGA
jgi:hypothetical protein